MSMVHFMKGKKASYIVGVVTLFALGVFGTVLVHALWYDPQDEIPLDVSMMKSSSTKTEITQKVSPLPNPLRLTIPALTLNANIKNVGITAKGNMATPTNFTDVGWYKYGTVPGHVGSVVMSGHVDNGLALPGVFKNLKNLKKGDDIYVEMADGTKIHYTVLSLSTYDYDAIVPTIFHEKNAHYLKLITCTGVWVPSFKTHDKRLVVNAVEA